ncbi:Chaperone protein dnaJ 6 [Galdieria sulphuraria]|uniref:DnaJ homolog subfamily C member 9 n=1 Tax=Galdieria sulphuraria TaxID=130081 RepID=M2XZS6_GALSU|nr:DnaJ homolog subfamily C member 9 [Galdieria sulphuraria]EME29084.1 DnaJ homolog subfamily C member 9 [Galdieria sulphuraria]GJD12713.1 Chaperone protein dnaJ 6 [Galdieria sulphuraria]|eukprot:XP_005705604.1 DnaJ homolog subfamily C member 9 [Galdieria sulphuraria]
MVDFYEVAGVSRNASKEEIKKAYRKLVIKVHPDKNRDDPDATSKFQSLQHIFEVLLDEEKRKIYDETGQDPDSDECFSNLSPEDILRFCRQHFGQVTEESIIEMERKYRGSKEEEEDLKQFYIRFQGNLQRILFYIICSDDSDIPRFVRFYDECISKGLLESTRLYKQSKRKMLKRCKSIKERNLSSVDNEQGTPRKEDNKNSLTQLILSNQKKRSVAFDNFCDAILEKATQNKKRM